MTTNLTEAHVGVEVPDPTELLIKEARQVSRRRHRRWAALGVILSLVALIVAAGVGRAHPSARTVGGGADATKSALALACTPSEVTISNGSPGSPATQEEPHLLRLTNSSSTSCVMNGYVTIVAYGAGGATLPFTFSHRATGGYPLTHRAPAAFTVAVHRSAYVFFAQDACVTGYSQLTRRVAVRLPGARLLSPVVTLSSPLAWCHGSFSRVGNVIATSPLEPTIAATIGPIR